MLLLPPHQRIAHWTNHHRHINTHYLIGKRFLFVALSFFCSGAAYLMSKRQFPLHINIQINVLTQRPLIIICQCPMDHTNISKYWICMQPVLYVILIRGGWRTYFLLQLSLSFSSHHVLTNLIYPSLHALYLLLQIIIIH